MTPLVAYKATSDVVSKAVTLLVTIAAARVLSPASFGLLALAMTTGWLLGVATDAGLPLYLAREAARRDRHVGRAFRDVMRLRLLLATAAFAIALVGGWVWVPASTRLAFLLIVASQLLGAVLETNAHLYRGMGRSEIDSTISLITRAVTGVLAAIVVIGRPSLLNLSLALLLPVMIAVVVSITIAQRLVRTGDRDVRTESDPRLTYSAWRAHAAPIGAGVLLAAFYFRCDVYFLEYWHGLEVVGAYNAGFRLIEALRLIPAAVLAVTFPLLCQATSFEPLRRVATALTLGGMLMMVALMGAAPWIVAVVYGIAYESVVPAVRILSLALPLFCLNYALTHQVIGWNGQRSYVAITAAALVANVVGNTLLIPSQGMVGAAMSTVLTEIVVAVGCVLVLRARVPESAIPATQPLGEPL